MPEIPESIRATRSAEKILVILSILLIVLSVSDRQTRPIDRALNQLQLLDTLPLNRFFDTSLLWTFHLGDVTETRSEFGKSISSYPWRRRDVKRNAYGAAAYYWTKPSTLREFFQFFNGQARFSVVRVLPGIAEYERAYSNLLQNNKRLAGNSLKLTGMSLFCGLLEHSDYENLPTENPLFKFPTLSAPDEITRNGCNSVILHFESNLGPLTIQLTDPKNFDYNEMGYFSGVGYFKWLEPLGKPYSDLAYESRGVRTVLGDLQPYWQEIKNFTPEEATRYLRSSHEALRRQANVFGLSIESPVIFVFAAPAILLILLYCSSHLRQAWHDAQDGTLIIHRSDWIALYPHWESLILSWSAGFGLPVLAMSAIVWRVDTPLAIPAVFINIGAVIITALLAVRNMAFIMKLRTRAQRPTPALELEMD
jgi:hypothetical protein